MAFPSAASVQHLGPDGGQRTFRDCRRHPRFALKLSGRLLTAAGHETPCETVDVSAGGLAIASTARPERGEPIIVYLDLLGRVEGTAVREIPQGFALELKVPAGRDCNQRG